MVVLVAFNVMKGDSHVVLTDVIDGAVRYVEVVAEGDRWIQ